MNPNQIQKLILPELQKSPVPRDQSVSEKSSKTGRDLYETKPKFVAKRLDEDTLFESTIKPKDAQLELIAEEEPVEQKGTEIDYNLDYDKFNAKVPETENIFKSEMLSNAKYKEHNKGPSFKTAGGIVRHSIVGSLDHFEKMDKKIKRAGTAASVISFDKDGAIQANRNDTSSNDISFHQQHSKMGIRPMSTKSHDQVSGSFMAGSKKSSMSKKENKNLIKVSKDQVLGVIEQIKHGEENFYQERSQKLHNLPLGDQLHLSKQQRILDKYEQRTSDWERVVDRNNRKIGRGTTRSVASRGTDHRIKKETNEVLDVIKNDQERYGSIYWYMTLRKRDVVSALTSKKKSHQEEDSIDVSFLEKRNQDVEIIRKPAKFAQTTQEFGYGLSMKNFGKQGREYMNSKLQSKERILQQVRPPNINDVKDLMLEGTNKLNLEVDAFFKGQERTEKFTVPKGVMERRKEEKVEMVYAEHYDKTEVLKQGLQGFKQI